MIKLFKRIISLLLCMVLIFLAYLWVPRNEVSPEVEPDTWNTNYNYVFVHGLMGWGSYDAVYKLMPYWGMFGRDLITYLNQNSFNCYSASVSATRSAWDRACELYAQLTGTVVDYGEHHSKECGHERFGEDYTGKALVPEWNEKEKINLLGHSFGGATVRMLAHLMKEGSAEEQAVTDASEISGLFTGGKEDWIYSITALAAPHNGTTAYGLGAATAEDLDSAAYDMHIDNALKLNEELTISDSTYYFSIACSMTEKNSDGTHSPIEDRMEGLFVDSSAEMGRLTGTTAGGYKVDEQWLENDGLVNTYSALYPLGQKSTDFDETTVTSGIWNVMPVYEGDHMSLQGGMTKVNNVRPYYIDLLSMINSL